MTICRVVQLAGLDLCLSKCSDGGDSGYHYTRIPRLLCRARATANMLILQGLLISYRAMACTWKLSLVACRDRLCESGQA